jgi:hypothetical protein
MLRELDAGWMVSTGERLIGTFEVVETHIALIDFPCAVQVDGLLDQLACVFEVAMIAFYEWILLEGHQDGVVGALWRANHRINPQA